MDEAFCQKTCTCHVMTCHGCVIVTWHDHRPVGTMLPAQASGCSSDKTASHPVQEVHCRGCKVCLHHVANVWDVKAPGCGVSAHHHRPRPAGADAVSAQHKQALSGLQGLEMLDILSMQVHCGLGRNTSPSRHTSPSYMQVRETKTRFPNQNGC